MMFEVTASSVGLESDSLIFSRARLEGQCVQPWLLGPHNLTVRVLLFTVTVSTCSEPKMGFFSKESIFTLSSPIKVREVANCFCSAATVTFVQSSGRPGLIRHLQPGKSSACLLAVCRCLLSPVVPSFHRTSGAGRQMWTFAFAFPFLLHQRLPPTCWGLPSLLPARWDVAGRVV